MDSLKPLKKKQPAKVSELSLVIVTWEDAQHDTDYDGSPERAESNLPLLEDVGWLLKLNKRVVLLASERCTADSTCRWIMKIPRSLVRSITYLDQRDVQWQKSSTPKESPSSTNATPSDSSPNSSPPSTEKT